jgi:uncharacterized protein (DUF1800 family)
MNHQQKVQHLFWRAGFGASPSQIKAAAKQPLAQLVRQLFKDSQAIAPIQIVQREPHAELKALKKTLRSQEMSKEEKRAELKELVVERRETIGQLNNTWVEAMASSQAALREKMTLFWHNHFACRSKLATFVQNQNNTLRQHALGHFGDLLMAISKDAAMLQFLNNQQNRKKSPNENFARELMELFALGRGHYTEQDVKEAARAFTGWGFNLQGQFVFRENQHDDGTKTIFGKTGRFVGEDVIEMLLSTPQTAQHIAAKIYRYFVNERVNPTHVASMAQRFYKSNYDIADLMQYVFEAEWFYETTNVGAQIKSPVELLTGMQRQLGVRFDDKKPVLYVQKALGQMLFFPPNVAGWPGGQNWIDSTTLLTRMQLPRVILNNENLNLRIKDNGDANEEQPQRKDSFSVSVNWQSFANNFNEYPDSQLVEVLASYLIQVPVSRAALLKIQTETKATARPELVQKLTTKLLSFPEYQVC